MNSDAELLEETAENLFEEAPCGYISTRLDGTIVRVNRTFESWTGLTRERLLAGTRFQDLLSAGGRIYHETHYAPLLQMQGSVREIAVEIIRADGSAFPALVNSVLKHDAEGRPRVIRTTIFDATDRRRYEQELLLARQRERDIAQQLQRSMLSGAVPSAPGLEIEIAYRPAVSGLEVGGDWYDAFWLQEDATIGLVVGDVVGRGIDAAVTMGQLRSAVRALAGTGLAPGPLLDALDRYARRHDVGRLTTLVYAELNLATGHMAYACAGHPPPLLLAPGEEPCFLWDGRSTPLDAYVDAGSTREQSSLALADGATVLFFTDGLIELRSRPHDDGMQELLNETAARRSEATASLVSATIHALHDPHHPDDVCLLAVSRRRSD